MLVTTRGIYEAVAEGQLTTEELFKAIDRFTHNDWGLLCQEDEEVQEEYIESYGDEAPMIMGVYKSKENLRFWVTSTMAEGGKGRDTTVLLPEEY